MDKSESKRIPPGVSTLEAILLKLKDAGLTPRAHMRIYLAVLKDNRLGEKLAHEFEAMGQAGFTPQSHPTLYDAIDARPDRVEELPAAFIAMKTAGMSLEEYPTLYDAIIANPYSENTLPAAFIAMKTAGMSLEEYPTLYDAIIANSLYANELTASFIAMKTAGMSLEKYPTLYDALIETSYYAMNMATAFIAMESAGISLESHPKLYDLIIEQSFEQPFFADKLPAEFETLKAIGVTVKEHLAFYKFVLEKQLKNIDLQPILDKFKELAIKAPDYIDIINKALNTDEVSLNALTWLQKNKFQIDTQLFIYKAFFTDDKPLVSAPYTMTKVKNQLDDYFQTHPHLPPTHKAYDEQCQAIRQIIDKALSAEHNITAGPLNKSAASMKIEEILARIIREPLQIQMQYDDQLGYLLQFGDEPQIYLSEILRLANFNHIELTDEQVALLGDVIEARAPGFNTTPSRMTSTVLKNLLPKAANSALGHYAGSEYFENINRLFRGVKLTSKAGNTWAEESSNSLIANFLTGCLLNWSAAALPRKLFQSKERKLLEKVLFEKDTLPSEVIKRDMRSEADYQKKLKLKLSEEVITPEEYNLIAPLFSELNDIFPSYELLDRGETFNDSGEHSQLSIIQRRTANPVFTPSLMSLSIFAKGVDAFHRKGSVRTKIEAAHSTEVVINPGEAEVLYPSGTTLIYAINEAGDLFARRVNSPGILPRGGWWSSTAIAEAYRHYLNKPYSKPDHQITIDDITIDRPNHGLAHTYRVMIFIDIIIDYFAHHASDERFRLFCQDITEEEREWLRVAAAFSITGRDNKLSATEDLAGYDKARETSKEHMELFLKKYPPPPSPDQAMQARMLNIVRWMGNPAYEKAYNHKPAINKHPDQHEKQHRNYIHRILTLAHKLDLPRCYEPKRLHEALATAREHVTQSDDQQADYIRMIQYAIDLMDAHGDRLYTTMNTSGELIHCSKHYRKPFEKVSKNLRQLHEITEAVPYPKLTEAYQYREQVSKGP